MGKRSSLKTKIKTLRKLFLQFIEDG